MRTPRRLSTVVAASLLIGTVGALPAAAEHVEARSIDPACADAPEDDLADTGADGSEQESAVDCLVWYAVTQGVTATSYEPTGDVTRGEMAAFLARVMRTSDTPFAEPGETEDHFVDDNGGTFEEDIDFVAKHEVAEGTSETTFSPAEPVTRGQMAKFLVAMLTAVGIDVPEPSQDYFADDDGGAFEDFINQVAELGVATGVSETAYAPEQVVTRGQMARFLARGLGALADNDLLTPPGQQDVVPTDAPQLVAASEPAFHDSASCTETAAEDLATHVRLDLTFDEAITGRSVPDTTDGFTLVGFDAARTTATAARLSSSDDAVAQVCFPADAWTTATTVAVARDTVGDAGDLGNPEGAIGVKAVTLSGTTAPELVAIEASSATQYQLTFDEAIASVDGDAFRLVAADGTVFSSTTATGSGTEVTAEFPDTGDATIVRAAALTGAVIAAGDDDANAVTVLRFDDPSTSGPDLASVSYRPDATRARNVDGNAGNETVPVDEVRFAFDVSVLEQDDNVDDFVLVNADGTTATPAVNQAPDASTEDPVVRSSQNARVVVVEYPDGALQSATGAAVLGGAVRAAGGDQPVNRIDGLARSPQLTYRAGATLAPTPVSAEVASTNVLIGTNFTVTVTFDEAVDPDALGAGTITLYDEQGRAFTIGAAPTRDENDPSVISVTTGSPQVGTNAEIASNAVLVGLAPDTVADAEGHGSHPQGIAP